MHGRFIKALEGLQGGGLESLCDLEENCLLSLLVSDSIR
jgi:hypothetical protein